MSGAVGLAIEYFDTFLRDRGIAQHCRTCARPAGLKFEPEVRKRRLSQCARPKALVLTIAWAGASHPLLPPGIAGIGPEIGQGPAKEDIIACNDDPA